MSEDVEEQTTYIFKRPESERLIFRPREGLTVSQWAEKYRIVETGSMPGRWKNNVTPYAVEPMDCWTVPTIRKIILCWAPQTAKTQVAFNCLGFSIDQDPGPAMYVMPDEKVTKRISRRRIIPMIERTPKLKSLLGPRSADKATLAVRFVNGMDLMLAWATSAAELASESIRYLFLDEIDKYPDFSGKEADPISLSEIRTIAYPYNKKILKFTTPTVEGGNIDRALISEADEIRDYHVPCPVCDELQVMIFDNIVWPQDIRDPRLISREKRAHYACRSCGMSWDDSMRNAAVKKGKWIPRTAVNRPEAVAFHLPSWYSPFVSLSDVAASFIRGLDDPSKLMVFVTQHKAEPWKEIVERKEDSAILSHKTNLPPGVVPKWAFALTAGIDMQKDHFCFVVRAWDEDLNSHLVQYGYLFSWADIEALLFQTKYQVEDSASTMGISRAGLDTGGGSKDGSGEWTRTEEAYQWLRKHAHLRIAYGTKGSSRPHITGKRVRFAVIDKMDRGNRPIPGGLELHFLDTSQYKGLIHWRLSRTEGETQRFYLHSETGVDYARQILAEELRRDRHNRVEWKQVRKDNHYLDCEVIAAACADDEWMPNLKQLSHFMKAGNTGRRIISKGLNLGGWQNEA